MAFINLVYKNQTKKLCIDVQTLLHNLYYVYGVVILGAGFLDEQFGAHAALLEGIGEHPVGWHFTLLTPYNYQLGVIETLFGNVRFRPEAEPEVQAAGAEPFETR